MESANHFHPSLIATILQAYLLSLCVLLFQQSHLFLICVVSTYHDSRINLHKPCQIPRNCQCKWRWASYSAPRTSFGSYGLHGSYCFTWVRLYPLRSQVLYHHSVPRIVSRFTSFTENFVIRNNKMTKNGPLWARPYQCIFCKKPL